MTKKSRAFFENLKEQPFNNFMRVLEGELIEYCNMMSRAWQRMTKGKEASKNHLYKMRQKSMDIEKLGKQFRDRTIKMQKENKND